MFEITFSPQAIRQLKSLERNLQERIKAALERNLRMFPPKGDVVKLEYADNRFRLRVDDWRVTFRYVFENQEVHIAEVIHRSKAYR